MMNNLIEKCVSEIANNNNFGITGVYNIALIKGFNSLKVDVEILKKALSSGKANALTRIESTSSKAEEDILLLSFYDQNRILFYTLIHSNTKLKSIEVLKVVKFHLLEINDEQKNKVISNFRKLKDIEKKFVFWLEEIGIHYAEYLTHIDYYHGILDDFDISSNEENWLQINGWLLRVYKDDDFIKTLRLLELKQLKKNFAEERKVTKKKHELIVAKIKEVEESFIKPSYYNSFFGTTLNDRRYNTIYDAGYTAFEDYLKYSLPPDYSKIKPGRYTIESSNGAELAKFLLYLKDLLEKSKKNILTDELEDIKLGIKPIALLLELAGFLEGCNADITDKARILSELINVSEKELYDAIRDVGTPDIKKNKKYHADILYFLEYVNAKGIKDSIKAKIDLLN